MQLNTIYCGDCAHVLAYFPECSVDLLYVDPPFFSNKHYEIIWGNGYERRAYEDRWKGGKRGIKNYIAWMQPKIEQCHRILKPTGSMYLHCDWRANAHLRILMDKIFGEENFRNEIIWCYSGGGIPKKNFPGKHDTIFRYSKSNDYFYVPEYRPYSAGTLQRGRTQVKGKYYANGLRKEGTPVPDWWTDIKCLHSPTDKEKLGYPTQKSEALLERIIKASSNPTDIVLDPMCGCGTAIATAHKLGRRWIGIDVSPVACKVMTARMQKLGLKIAENDIIGLPKSVEQLEAMVPFEFQNWVIQKLDGRPSRRKVGDFGVDGWLTNGEPVQIKQSKRIGRNVVDNFETAIRREGKKAGLIVALSFGKGANEEVARAKQDDGLEIRLKTVKDLIKEI